MFIKNYFPFQAPEGEGGGGGGGGEESIRDALEAAFDAVEEEEEVLDDEQEQEKEEETGGSGKDTKKSVGGSGTEEEEEELEEEDEEGEDDEPAGKGGKDAKEKEGRKAEAETVPPELEKAPVSWKVKAREAWKDVPVEARREILRREEEVRGALQTSAQARQFQEQFFHMVRPYLPYIQAEGVNPMQATQSLLQVAATLQSAPQIQKARTIAELILRYGVDVRELDAVLSEQISNGVDPTKYRQMVDQAVAPYRQRLQQYELQGQQQSQQLYQSVMQELEEFSKKPEAEFFHDVKDKMADLLEAAAKRGETLSLQDAYNQAIQLDPDVREILEQRNKAAKAKERAKKAKDKKRAASSVRGSHASGERRSKKSDGGLRADIEAAWASLEEQ